MDNARTYLSRGKRKHRRTYVSRLNAKVCVTETQSHDIRIRRPTSIDTRNRHANGCASRIDNTSVQNGGERLSVRRFKPDDVPEADIVRILDAARLAPTSGNRQPWQFLVVRDSTKIVALKTACVERTLDRMDPEKTSSKEQQKQREASVRKAADGYFSAPVYIVILTDNQSKYPDYNHWDGPLAAGYLMLAARALGYGTVFITDAIPEEITKKVLNIPDRYTRVCITPIGVPVAWPESPSKKPLEDFIAREAL